MQQRSELTCDGFGFCRGSREAEQEVIRGAGVTEPSRVRVVWITLRQPLEHRAELPVPRWVVLPAYTSASVGG